MLFVGDDWAQDHHDIEIVDGQGRRLARRRLPEGLDGVFRLHALIASVMPAEWKDLAPADAAARVKISIETDRGPWVVSSPPGTRCSRWHCCIKTSRVVGAADSPLGDSRRETGCRSVAAQREQ
jgi:hypothetical protein